jgi:ribonuclease P protein component
MFASKNRFSFKKGVPRKTFSNSFLFIRYDKTSIPRLECAVVVGKKVDGRAVLRNSVKRMLVSIIKELVDTDSHYKIVVYAKKSILNMKREEIREQMTIILNTIGIIK